ncbi:MAG: 50S ribosomal protein L6 [Gammaproteobacteria bacterium]
MSRVAKKPIQIPSGVEVSVDGQAVTVKGPKGTLVHEVHESVSLQREDNVLNFEPRVASPRGWAFAGTTRALINNMVAGVSTGFERKLELVGVGYRAQTQGKTLNLTLGYSHPINFDIPEGITIETPSQTEVVVRGTDKQQVGQVAAKIRAFRAPEPYKGKGVKYSDEVIIRKEAKKK